MPIPRSGIVLIPDDGFFLVFWYDVIRSNHGGEFEKCRGTPYVHFSVFEFSLTPPFHPTPRDSVGVIVGKCCLGFILLRLVFVPVSDRPDVRLDLGVLCHVNEDRLLSSAGSVVDPAEVDDLAPVSDCRCVLWVVRPDFFRCVLACDEEDVVMQWNVSILGLSGNWVLV